MNKFGSMDIGVINIDDIKQEDLKAMWKQTEGLMRKMDDIPMMTERVVFVPQSEYEYFGRDSVKAAAAKMGIMVVPVDYSDPYQRNVAHLYTTIEAANTSRLYDLPDSAKYRIEMDAISLPPERYHDRTFSKDYQKKKKAKRRQQKQARRRNK